MDSSPVIPELDSVSGSPGQPRRRYYFGGRWRKHDFGRVAARLGTVPDTHLAREIGCNRHEIRKLRTRLGIPAYVPAEAVIPFLGKSSDRALAIRFRVSQSTIRKLRRERGIPPCDLPRANAAAELRDYVRAVAEELR